ARQAAGGRSVDDFGKDPGRLSDFQVGWHRAAASWLPAAAFVSPVECHELDACWSRQASRSAGLGWFRECCARMRQPDKDSTEMVTINCDMGEAFGLYKMGDDEGLMPEIDVANVACGFHGSDFNHMRKTVRLAKRHGVKVGAHPSLPDLQGFGRREMKIGREELTNCLLYQIGALKAFLDAEGVALN